MLRAEAAGFAHGQLAAGAAQQVAQLLVGADVGQVEPVVGVRGRGGMAGQGRGQGRRGDRDQPGAEPRGRGVQRGQEGGFSVGRLEVAATIAKPACAG